MLMLAIIQYGMLILQVIGVIALNKKLHLAMRHVKKTLPLRIGKIYLKIFMDGIY
jgi:hypothetical protein